MKTRLQKWGNSLGLRIPKMLALETHLDSGKEVDIVAEGESLVIRAVCPRSHKLSELLSRMTPANRHDEADFGKHVGKEIW